MLSRIVIGNETWVSHITEIEAFGWEVLDHAPYSPDFAPSDIHLFRSLKHNLGGKRFSDNEEVKKRL
ncbi:hypothetical protein TNCV_835801 [Trichonephila clavipes]|nr:hypothetical protein TNCV_835801 [Trichonephila clavipes]